MQIGIGLPGTIPGTKGEQIVEWARRADAGPFSSLASLDRLVYRNYESLIMLAAAAAGTPRVRMMTTVLLAPLRNPAFFAKQAASLDALSRGRLTLGVGAREDDYRAAGVDFHARGRLMNAQLKLLRQVWSGEPLSADTGPIVPAPVRSSGPELLIGGYSPDAIRRMARWGDGYIAGGGGGPAQIQEMLPRITEAWQAANRPGKPRVVAAFYCALDASSAGGAGTASAAGAYIRDYYGFLGPRAEAMANALPLTAEAIRDKIKAYAAAAVDE